MMIKLKAQNSKLKTFLSQGFTLVELLVVISIIGVLASLVLVSFTGTQKQARDTQRKNDLKQYQTAFENYANTHNGLYVSNIPGDPLTALCPVFGLTNCPEDPKYPGSGSAQQYRYSTPDGTLGNPDATEYFLWATLENTTGYWVVCSNGKSGISPTLPAAICPL